MEQENKNKLVQSLETIKASMARWEHVKSIAEDIIAWTTRDAKRFKIEIGVAVGTKILQSCLKGTRCYAYFGEESSQMTLSELLEKFFSDDRALINMIEALSEAIVEIVKELKEQLEEEE